MFRTAITLFTVGVSTLAVSLITIVLSIFGPYSRAIFYSTTTWTKLMLFSAGAKLEIVGLDNIDKDKSYIFVGNHQSHFDVPAVYSVIPFTTRFMTKKELFRIPVFGWAMKAAGTIKIDRSDRSQSIASVNDALDKIRNGVSVIIFPEGTRSADGSIGSFKKGGFVLAIKGAIPIIPVSISGSRFILPKHSLRVNPGKIKLVFGKPILTDGFTYQDREKLSEITQKFIIDNFEKHYNEN